MTKKLILSACVFALAACSETAPATGEGAGAPPAAAAAGEATQPGLYEIVNHTGGTFRTQLFADQTFTTSVDGEVVETGSWSWNDSRICFDGDGEGLDEVCWTQTGFDGQGGYTASRADGQSVTATRIE